MSKILILTSSPQRDRLVDELLKKELESLGNEVFVRPVPINAREAVLELRPDILVAPPIRNHFAFDLTETAARFGIAVAIRHIEPSCDESDIEVMPDYWRKQLLIQRPKDIKLELVWSPIEVRYVKTFCNPSHKMVPVGAFVADIYKVAPAKDSGFCEKYGLNPNKLTVLVSSPWGLSDIDSDRLGSSTPVLLKDTAGRDRWLDMIKELQTELGDDYNILATLHPGLLATGKYKEILDGLNIQIDTKSTATYLLVNCDYLVHSGSTMAIEMHWMNKPAFQIGDVNAIEMPDENWWHQKDSPISRVSPFFNNGKEIGVAIKSSPHASNANTDAIKALEDGRFGSMDGNATIRAASEINKLSGKFKVAWPKSTFNKPTSISFINTDGFFDRPVCPICEERFWATKQSFLDLIAKDFKLPARLMRPVRFECPGCGSPLGAEQEFVLTKKGNEK